MKGMHSHLQKTRGHRQGQRRVGSGHQSAPGGPALQQSEVWGEAVRV